MDSTETPGSEPEPTQPGQSTAPELPEQPDTAQPTAEDVPAASATTTPTSEPANQSAAADSQPQPAGPSPVTPPHKSRWHRLKDGYLHHKKWTIPLTIAALLALLAAIPYTRYAIAGLFIRKDFVVQVLDSTTHLPVSKATVQLGGVQAETGSSGNATLHVQVGNHTLMVTKKYYQSYSGSLLVPIRGKTSTTVQLAATGRQVPIRVTNKLDGKPVAGAVVSAAGTSAKTDSAGTATIVLPTGQQQLQATIKAAGFNQHTAMVTVTDQTVAANTFRITPAGQVYFLSNLSGKLDVVKTNLDGTNRQTVLPGTGYEDTSSTQLLASRDWKYLALIAQRSQSGGNKLYLINTTTDALSTIDSGTSDYSAAGWIGNDFFYTTYASGVELWQPHRQSLKMFNASTAKLVTVDQTTAQGTSTYDFAMTMMGQQIIAGNKLLYTVGWQSSSALTSDQQSGLYSVDTGGNKSLIKNFLAPSGVSYYMVNLNQYQPAAAYLQVPVGGKNVYYSYSAGNLQINGNVSDAAFYKNYPAFYPSPDGKQTFWAEKRDGKNTLLLGDANAQNAATIATLSDYSPYGWYGGYLLVASGGNNVLSVMSPDGKTVTKISDFHGQPDYPGAF